MKQKLLSAAVTIMSVFGAGAQDSFLTPQVLSAGGNYFQNSDFNVSQTIGEMTAVVTFSSSSITLTQGFQQSDLKSTVGISEADAFNADLNLFPNPATAYTRLQYTFPQPGRLEITIYNTLGQQVSERFSEKYSQGEQGFVLDTENIAAGVYYVNTILTAESGKQHSFSRKLEIVR